MIDFVGKRYWYFALSLLIIIPGVISLLIPPGLKLSVDFTGGTLWEIRFQQEVQASDVRLVLSENGLPDAVVQTSGDKQVLIRAKDIESESASGTRARLQAALQQRFGSFETVRFESVGPSLGGEVSQKAVQAVALAALGILLYISVAFRRVRRSFRFGACAIVALLHDALVVLGVFSILGKLFNVEVDSLFVTAVLTVIGFSVHDTIVVFDRIRENITRHAGESFEAIVNHSIMQTLVRSLNTSLTAALVMLALVLFGGLTTRNFALALLIGIVSGTYSSIFNASQLLVVWENGEVGRLFQRFRPQPQPAANAVRR
ncbi:MAG: protein translocase subunit SecF [Chloroflexi bacterium]|nr:protein translocase subunit SecF [Chloroflexota bacterium]MCL5108796.1 protein translocase subunit SecF [Chloroflexota bacterium]